MSIITGIIIQKNIKNSLYFIQYICNSWLSYINKNDILMAIMAFKNIMKNIQNFLCTYGTWIRYRLLATVKFIVNWDKH